MGLNERVIALREKRLKKNGVAVPDKLQGVSKEKIEEVLVKLDLGDKKDMVDAVFALIDNETENLYTTAPEGAKFCEGASTARVACHIGILQRGQGKIDREGRDHWIKPLRELGAIEAITLYEGQFIPGHLPKNPNCCYRLESEFLSILKAPDGQWQRMLSEWFKRDAIRGRRQFQAEAAELARESVENGHSDLIAASRDIYSKRFLPGYHVIYIDDGDGDRVSEKERETLGEAGIEITLEDAMPDVLLWNPDTDWLWVIEAVTSDGEVDNHKVNQVRRLANRCGKAGVGFTTAYRTWKEAASRQGSHGNIAVGTYIWIQADPAKQLLVESYQ